MDEHRRINREYWDERVEVHASSATYGLDRFEDPSTLSGVVAHDRHHLGELDGKDVVHLQCHIGTDTVSLARLGGRVTGYDFSVPALDTARSLAERAGVTLELVEGELYEAPDRLGRERFDVVYTGVGALCWLPDIDRWAQVVASLLRPGGRLVIRDTHPLLYALDDTRPDDLLVLAHPYFETEEPQRSDEAGSYADPDATFETVTTYEWNHGVGELLTAVLEAGLMIRAFEEHREVEWQPWGVFEPVGTAGRYRLPDGLADRVPLMFTLVAERPA